MKPKAEIEEMLNKRRQKMSGKKWYNNGKVELMFGSNDKIPDNFVKGRLLK